LADAAAAVSTVVVGKPDVIEQALVCIISGGHLLVEDVPGVGKTTLARGLAAVLGGQCRRIQCTSDLLPSDVIGVNMLRKDAFEFRAGPLFSNVVVADELNRASPKTQSALLEAMSERLVSVDGQTHTLPELFVVLATLNPDEDHGTFPLPDSQLDRFLLRIRMGYPDRDSERAILRRGLPEFPKAILQPDEVIAIGKLVDTVEFHKDLEDRLLDLIETTRQDLSLRRGASTRAAVALHRVCRALALIRGRAFVIPEDIDEMAVPCLAHRVCARGAGGRQRYRAEGVISEIVEKLPSVG